MCQKKKVFGDSCSQTFSVPGCQLGLSSSSPLLSPAPFTVSFLLFSCLFLSYLENM